MKQIIFTVLMTITLSFATSAQDGQPHYDLMDGDGTSKSLFDGKSSVAVGEKVLANWSYDEFWYSGNVEKIEEDKYFVKFDDNDGEWVLRQQLTPINIEKGSRVFCKKEGELVYKIAEVGEIDGERILLRYFEDKKTEWNIIRNIRLHL